MRQYSETRGKYQVECYEVDITPLMKKLALDFATSIIEEDNQFNRLLPMEVVDLDIQTQLRIQRTYVGKLAELAFSEFLLNKNVSFTTSGMFQIYEGEQNVDAYDFENEHQDTIDVKCGFRSNHKLLAINIEQFDSPNHKDYYVAVKLNGIDKEEDNKLIDLDSITKASILGYAEYDFLEEKARVADLGEGPARIWDYSKLMGIDILIRNW